MTENVMDMEPVKINKCKTDFTVNSQTGPSLRNSRKFFGKQLQLNEERKGTHNKTLMNINKKEIKNFDELKSKAVLSDELIRGTIAFNNKTSGKGNPKSKSKPRTGYLNRKPKDSIHYAKAMSNKDFNKTFGSSLGQNELGQTKSTVAFNASNGFETKNKSTVLPEEDLRKIGVMNSIINEFDDNVWNKRNTKLILDERDDAVKKVSKGELTKELAMLACYKIYLKILERTEKFEKFDLKNMIKDFIVARDGRKGKNLMDTIKNNRSPDKAKSLAALDDEKKYESMTRTEKERFNQSKLLSDISKERLMFPEVQEIFAGLRVGLCRDEAYAFCMDIVKSRLLVESIKKNMTIDEVKAVNSMDPDGDGAD